MPIIRWIRRFLLRLIRDPPFLLAFLFTCVTIGPFVILGFFLETPNWTYWFEILSFILQSNYAHLGIGVLVVIFTFNLVKTTVAKTLTSLQSWFSTWSDTFEWGILDKFDTFLWEMECALEQEKGKAIGTNYSKKIRKEQDTLEKKEKLQNGPYDEQKELTRRFYDRRMKYFGYQNYLNFLIKNGEELSKGLRDSVSEQFPAGDPLLIEETALAKMILRKEANKLDEQLKDGTWG